MREVWGKGGRGGGGVGGRRGAGGPQGEYSGYYIVEKNFAGLLYGCDTACLCSPAISKLVQRCFPGEHMGNKNNRKAAQAIPFLVTTAVVYGEH